MFGHRDIFLQIRKPYWYEHYVQGAVVDNVTSTSSRALI